MKKIIILSFLSSLIFSGCFKQENASKKQVLHLNLSSDPSSLDPRVVRSLKDLTIAKQIFEGLMRINEKGIPDFACAQDLTISEDGLKYTFLLRESYWSNQAPVTAYDFEYAWKKVLDPLFATDYSHMLYPIKNAKQARLGKCSLEEVGIKVLDPHTLEVTLECTTPYFLELVAFPTFFPINKNFEEKSPSWAQKTGSFDETSFVCNGPFRPLHWNPNDTLLLTKNTLYWDADHVFLDQLDFSMIADNTTESLLFQKGKIDWLGQPISTNIATELIGEFKRQNKLQSYPVAGTFWFLFNTEATLFNHQKIRKAFALALSRNDIITHILQGNQQIATSLLPPSMRSAKKPHFQDNDIAYANRLFDEALQELGIEKKDFPHIGLSYCLNERQSKIAQLVQQQWEQAFGITIKLHGMEPQLYLQTVKKGDFEIATGDWISDFNDPISFLEIFKKRVDSKTGEGFNYTGWEDTNYIKILDLAKETTVNEERIALLYEAENILLDKVPITPVYHYSFDCLKQNYVQNVFLSPLGIADFKSAKIVK